MSILDLAVRLTDDERLFGEYNKSSDSLILMKPFAKPDGSSVDLSVGEYWFDCKNEKDYVIGEDGFELHPNGFAVIESLQEVALPQNVFGLLTGKGRHIFRGILISPGKIDPTFRDKLRIGVFNAGRESLFLKKGEPLCSCCFFSMESEITTAIPRQTFGYRAIETRVPFSIRRARWMRDPIVIVILTALNVLALIATVVVTYLGNHHH